MADTATALTEIAFTPDEIDSRLTFHDALEVFEIDLYGVHFHNTADVNAFYDRCEERIEATGEPLWFFLIDYQGCRIDPEAWVAWARRGKAINLAHSMGTVRYDASPETQKQIKRAAGTDTFDPNLFDDRDKAFARLAAMPTRRRARIVHTPNHNRKDLERRIEFLMEDQIMEVDFSDLTLFHARDVNDAYDVIEDLVKRTDRKWYFLINYNGCRIMPEAWVQYAQRGKALNLAASLGSVRYAAGSETEADIRLRAESQGFRPNIRNTRDEALARIAELKTGT